MELIRVEKEHWNAVKEIYLEAFPKAERKPFRMLKHSAARGKAAVFAATENGVLQGFTAVIPYNDTVMIDYLAVSGKIRSRGTGSKILEKICAHYPEKRILLLIEQLDETASNFKQRVARKKFYEKNGFSSSGIFITGVSGTMEILTYGGSVNAEEFLAIQRYSLGRLLFALSKTKVIS